MLRKKSESVCFSQLKGPLPEQTILRRCLRGIVYELNSCSRGRGFCMGSKLPPFQHWSVCLESHDKNVPLQKNGNASH